ncbi:MAG: MerR family transcriptional regulator [Defluviitaleaceae bacterium]|nr:MerR family transcriptional regulator [Defluviitaleaceae bacterium]
MKKDYMTVGEIAKKMGVTVRTLHHYEKLGLLIPSAESESGYRLYSYKDMVTLNQILTMKHLGFSLSDIKDRLPSLDTPAEVAEVLAEHAEEIREKISVLSTSLQAVEALREEVLQMQTVDFKKYSDIIVSLMLKNEHYWAIKYMDDEMLDHIRKSFDGDMQRAEKIIKTMSRLNKESVRLHQSGISPESDVAIAFAKEFWQMTLDFVGGDESLLPKFAEFSEKINAHGGDKMKQFAEANDFVTAALEAYFAESYR